MVDNLSLGKTPVNARAVGTHVLSEQFVVLKKGVHDSINLTLIGSWNKLQLSQILLIFSIYIFNTLFLHCWIVPTTTHCIFYRNSVFVFSFYLLYYAHTVFVFS